MAKHRNVPTKRDHARLATGAMRGRKGRKRTAKTRLKQKEWDLKFREFLSKAPKELGPAEQYEWAKTEINKKYRYFAQGKGH